LSAGGKKIFLLINKIDARSPDAIQKEILQASGPFSIRYAEILKISAKKGLHLGQLMSSTWDQMPEGPIYYPDPDIMTDKPTRFFVSELIRKQLFLNLGEELPYSCGVKIQKYEERKGTKKPVLIAAEIHVERDSQKGMLIGKGGKKIKEIGTAARAEIESFLEKKIFLDLSVKVSKDWTTQSHSMEQMGYRTAKGDSQGERREEGIQ